MLSLHQIIFLTTIFELYVLSFENENLAMIIPRLERWYGRKIQCEESLLNNYSFTFKVRDESLDVILFIMRQSAPLQYKKNTDESYILTKKNQVRMGKK